ncbi:uncharacterized protein [Fopius arisanus]|uniref:Uncharacterized protein n=1 Tax=Fopius arisanus TaxID=64838 RepID=A0A9R1TIQ3_9HYME|nr:PREDICTED: uncharacterized protein LOC105270458 [Fopius arisanus]
MNNICGQYYKWNRILMTIVGIWPESSKFITLAAQSLVGLSTLSLVIPQYAFLARMCSILDDMIYVIIIQMITGLGVVKYENSYKSDVRGSSYSRIVTSCCDNRGICCKRMLEDSNVHSYNAECMLFFPPESIDTGNT